VSSKNHRSKRISRRQAIEALGAAGVVSLIGCGGGTASSTTTGTGTGSGSSSSSCVLTPELTVGPYFKAGTQDSGLFFCASYEN
jgi:hypothetical protein